VLVGIRTVHVLVSYPLGVRGLLTLFRGRYQTAIESLAEVLVVCGDHDEFTGAAAYSRWMDSLPSAKCVLVKGGTHFWRGADGDSLVEIVLAWLQTQ
jgi:alpha/beta superfamily hydrolase